MAVSTSVTITAAAPSDTAEQSLRLSGGATIGLRSETDVAAEVVSEVLAELGQRIGDTVAVVLRGDAGQRVGLVAVALEVPVWPFARRCRRSRSRCRPPPSGTRHSIRISATCGTLDFGHFLGPDHQHEPCTTGGDRVESLVDRRGSGGAGVLHPCRGLESQTVGDLERHRGQEALADESAAIVAQVDLVDVLRLESCVFDGVPRDSRDQRFDALRVQLAERRMGPALRCILSCQILPRRPCRSCRRRPAAGHR